MVIRNSVCVTVFRVFCLRKRDPGFISWFFNPVHFSSKILLQLSVWMVSCCWDICTERVVGVYHWPTRQSFGLKPFSSSSKTSPKQNIFGLVKIHFIVVFLNKLIDQCSKCVLLSVRRKITTQQIHTEGTPQTCLPGNVGLLFEKCSTVDDKIHKADNMF